MQHLEYIKIIKFKKNIGAISAIYSLNIQSNQLKSITKVKIILIIHLPEVDMTI